METAKIIEGAAAGLPTLHPLVVHFAVAFIPLAAVFQAISLRVESFRIPALLTAAAGVAAAVLAGQALHPHVTGLTPDAAADFETHERFADLTVWFSLAGAAALYAAFRSGRAVLRGAGLGLLVLATVFVCVAGHYGARLAYVHGVGPKGAHLESH